MTATTKATAIEASAVIQSPLASQKVSSTDCDPASLRPGMKTRAVFLDALGTLVELEPPWTRLGRALGDPGDAPVEAAMRKEMAYYREHAHEGVDDEAVAELRARCAALLSRELGREVDVATMMSAIRFHPAADARPALTRLRGLGLKLVCVSNWDVALPQVL